MKNRRQTFCLIGSNFTVSKIQSNSQSYGTFIHHSTALAKEKHYSWISIHKLSEKHLHIIKIKVFFSTLFCKIIVKLISLLFWHALLYTFLCFYHFSVMHNNTLCGSKFYKRHNLLNSTPSDNMPCHKTSCWPYNPEAYFNVM